MRNINFIKEVAKPGKRPLTHKNKASNKENTNGCQFCFRSEREELRISLQRQDRKNVYKFHTLRSFSLMTFYIYLLYIWKGDNILYPGNSCDQEWILKKINSCSYFANLSPEMAEQYMLLFSISLSSPGPVAFPLDHASSTRKWPGLHPPSSHRLTSQKEGIKWEGSGGGMDFCSCVMFRNSFLEKEHLTWN